MQIAFFYFEDLFGGWETVLDRDFEELKFFIDRLSKKKFDGINDAMTFIREQYVRNPKKCCGN